MQIACLQVRTTLARRTRSTRYVIVHAGRFTCRLRKISCCLNRAFSATSSDLLLPRSARVRSGKLVQTYQGHSAPITALCWSPDGSLIASASDDQTARIFTAPFARNREKYPLLHRYNLEQGYNLHSLLAIYGLTSSLGGGSWLVVVGLLISGSDYDRIR